MSRTNPPSSSPLEAGAVHFRSQALRAAKGFWQGTQRTRSPAETLERIRPCFPIAGLTRMANITGLDRIDIHTTLSIRPGAKTLTTSSGKGFTLDAAMASGAMEGIELFHCEEAALPSVRRSYDDLAGEYTRIPVEQLQFTKDAIFSPQWRYHWTFAWDLVHQREVAVPLAAVHMGLGERVLENLHTFQLTSNGLASGNELLEAINAGLFEVIERDAIALYRTRWARNKVPPAVVRLETIEHPLVLDLLARLERARVAPVLFDCTTDTDVPVYMAYVYDLEWRNFGVFKGYGAHLDPEIAMVRAITEAIQSRVIYIAGSRDDVFRHQYLRLKRDDDNRSLRGFKAIAREVDARQRRSQATPTFEGDTLVAMEKLRRVGLDQVLVLDLSRPDFPINVVKVIVPGLEGYMFDFYAPGPRARAITQEPQG